MRRNRRFGTLQQHVTTERLNQRSGTNNQNEETFMDASKESDLAKTTAEAEEPP